MIEGEKKIKEMELQVIKQEKATEGYKDRITGLEKLLQEKIEEVILHNLLKLLLGV